MKASALEYKTIGLRGKATLLDQEDGLNSVHFIIRIKKDSIIWGSVKGPLGIEIIRFMAFEDSVVIINKLKREVRYIKGSLLSEFTTMDVDLAGVEAMLLGNPWNMGSRNGKTPLLTIDSLTKESYFTTVEAADLLNETVVNAKNYKIQSTVLSDKLNGLEVMFEYSEFIKIDKEMVPAKIIVNINSGHESTVQVLFTDIKLNKKFDYPFKIPASYDKVYE
ncbi:MAG: DUF4292 domain-containing protein [Bacteroidetes bacterium]|nr:DUF4292 domain-containing protein [Bacteroidota bacterium]